MSRFAQRETLMYFISFILVISFLVSFYHLYSIDLQIPFSYNGDALLEGAVIKGIVDNGWYNINNYLGAPFHSQLFDFPMGGDNLNLLWIKLLAVFLHKFGLIQNVFFILTFVLEVLVSLFVLRKLGISRTISVVISFIYSIAPYHFMRGEYHLFLSSYYAIPVMLLLLIWITHQVDWIDERNRITKTILFLIMALIISSSGIYYAFFSCFFLAIAGLYAIYVKKKKEKFYLSLISIGTVGFFTVVNLLPSILYRLANGTNTLVANRSSAESEYYGLKVIQLLLPEDNYRIGFIAHLKSLYDMKMPLVNENSFASLGIIGSVGFLLLLLNGLYRKHPNNWLMNQLSTYNLSAVLLSTIGGLGVLVSMLVPEIRAYNRMSIIILYFSLFAVGIVLDNSIKKIKLPVLRVLVVAIILAIAIFDQTNKSFIPPYNSIKAEYDNDHEFIQRIEKSIKPGSMVFQLPYVPFPENPPVNRMGDYELLKGYLHSNTLHWSYGAMKGRQEDQWIKDVSNKNIQDMVDTLAYANFEGIYIDRFGYSDNGNGIISDLSKMLGSPMTSQNGRLVFYNLESYKHTLLGKMSPAQISKKKDEVLHPIEVSWAKGFYGLEQSSSTSWRWCDSHGEIDVFNPSDQAKSIILDTIISTGEPQKSDMIIKIGSDIQSLKVNNAGAHYKKEILLHPGLTRITFTSGANQVNAPNDPRVMYFRLENTSIKEVGDK